MKKAQTLLLALCLGIALPTMAFNLNLNKLGKLVSSTKDMFSGMDREKQNELGASYAARLIGASGLYESAEAQRYVNQVGQWLALQLESDITWHFAVLDSSDVNAFSTISGHIFITKGLAQKFTSEDQLAAVLAHEMIHVLNAHHLDAIKNEKSKGFAQALADYAQKENDQSSATISAAVNSSSEVWVKGLDKEFEYEADQWGAVLAGRAGYDPYAILEVMMALEQLDQRDQGLQLMLATHPTPRQRIEASSKVIDTIEANQTNIKNNAKFEAFKQQLK